MFAIYFYLGLMAVFFFAFGYLLRAFYFEKKPPAADAETGELRRALGEKQRELGEARDEVAKTAAVVRSLEEQIRHRNEEMENLRRLAEGQDEELRQLQKDAETIRGMLQNLPAVLDTPSGEGEHPAVDSDGTSPLSPTETEGSWLEGEEKRPLPPAKARGEVEPVEEQPAAPTAGHNVAWKKNLDSILNILDSMEKEVQK